MVLLTILTILNILNDATTIQPAVNCAFAETSLLQNISMLSRDMIIFNSNRTGNDEIYVMNPDGSGVRQLTKDNLHDSWWGRISPDRTQILFYQTPKGVHDDNYSQNNLWVMNADGTSPRLLRPAGMDGWKIQGHAEWAPDGKQLVMFGGQSFEKAHIFITDNMGRYLRRLTGDKSSNHVDPSWSPDGAVIVFTACPTKKCSAERLEVFTIPVSGTQSSKRLTNDSIADYDPYYSPDGKMMSWLSMTDHSASQGVWSIRVSSSDGTGVRFVINDGNINGYPSWSRDGKTLYFHRFVYGKSEYFSIWAIALDGNELRQITRGENGNDEYPSTMR